MKAFIFLILFCGIAEAKEFDFTFDPLSTTGKTSKQSKTVKFGTLDIKENTYGLGVGADQFGRPVRAKPAW